MNRYDYIPDIDDMGSTMVSNVFINHCIPKARGDYVKVYMYGLKLAMNPQGRFPDNGELAAALKLTESDVVNAWNYWKEEGIVNVITEGPDQVVEFRNLISHLFVRSKSEKITIPRQRPKVTAMCREIEEKVSRLLTQKEVETFLFWMDEYKFSPQMIVLMVSECVGRGKKDYRYWDSVAVAYNARGIRTFDQALDYVNETKRRWSDYKAVLNTLGLYRMPSLVERKHMDVWFDEIGLSLEDVLKACDETLGASWPNISYLDKIITGDRQPAASRSRRAAPRKKQMLEHEYDDDEIQRALFGE